MTNTKYPDSFELVDRFGEGANVQVEYDGYSGQYEWTYTGGAVRQYSEEDTHNLIDLFYEVVKTEPELVFPFTVQHVLGDVYTISKGANSKVDCTNCVTNNITYGLWSQELCKKFIKAGTWIVKSVGETVKINLSPKENVSSLTIKVDSSELTQATANMNALAQAVENVNISLESMQQIMGRMGLVNGLRPERRTVTCTSINGDVLWTKDKNE